MNFWATRLGLNTAPAQPAAAPAATPRPWYLSDHVQQQPAPQQPVGYPQQNPGYPQPPVEETPGWGTIQGSMAKAQSAKLTELCPECGSGNYFRPKGMPNALLQCYECGFNPRFSQTGGEGGLPSSESGPATPARQLATAGAGGVSQFSPSTIVGRI